MVRKFGLARYILRRRFSSPSCPLIDNAAAAEIGPIHELGSRHFSLVPQVPRQLDRNCLLQ